MEFIKCYEWNVLDSNMFVLISNKKAIIIDPHKNQEMLQVIKSEQVDDILILLTHEHFDHISGVNWLRENTENVNILCSNACGLAIEHPTKNLAAFSSVFIMTNSVHVNVEDYDWDEEYSCFSDETFEDEMEFEWEGHLFFLKETPGHSPGSICIIMDNKYLFSGDTLVTGHPTITRLPGGSKKEFKEITIPYLKTLNPEMMVYPGHGELQKLKEFNFYEKGI